MEGSGFSTLDSKAAREEGICTITTTDTSDSINAHGNDNTAKGGWRDLHSSSCPASRPTTTVHTHFRLPAEDVLPPPYSYSSTSTMSARDDLGMATDTNNFPKRDRGTRDRENPTSYEMLPLSATSSTNPNRHGTGADANPDASVALGAISVALGAISIGITVPNNGWARCLGVFYVVFLVVSAIFLLAIWLTGRAKAAAILAGGSPSSNGGAA